MVSTVGLLNKLLWDRKQIHPWQSLFKTLLCPVQSHHSKIAAYPWVPVKRCIRYLGDDSTNDFKLLQEVSESPSMLTVSRLAVRSEMQITHSTIGKICKSHVCEVRCIRKPAFEIQGGFVSKAGLGLKRGDSSIHGRYSSVTWKWPEITLCHSPTYAKSWTSRIVLRKLAALRSQLRLSFSLQMQEIQSLNKIEL